MTEQQKCRQFRSVPYRAGQEPSTVLACETGLQGLRSCNAIPTLGGSVYQAPSWIDAQAKPEGTGPALTCLPFAPPRPKMNDALIDPDIRDLAHGIRRVCIATPRGRFFALVAGTSTSFRPTVVLVHGYMADKRDFLPIIPHFVAAGYRVCAIELRGHSETALLRGTEADDDMRLPALGRDILDIIAALGCAPVHLLAHSLGGLVAQEAALIDARPIATLTLCGSGPGAVGRRHARWLRLLGGALRVLPRDRVWKAMRAYQTRQLPNRRRPAVDAERERLLRHRFRLHSRRALLVGAHELRTAKDRSGEVRELGLRTLVVHGARESVWPRDRQREMAERLNAPLVVIPDAGHSPHVHNPSRTARALLAFWADADAAGQPTPATTGAVPAPTLQHQPADMTALVGTREESSAA
jgi:pimeloyl-ACP methyl ester carboxylesterase